MKRLLAVLAVVGVLVLALSGSALGATFNVPTPAYPTIQAGINAAGAGDTVLVAAGTYGENITLKNGVVVQGAGAGVSIIDGSGGGLYSNAVLATGVDATTRLDGFTITNSYMGVHCNDHSSPTITNNAITANYVGMYNEYYSSPLVSHNQFTSNSSIGVYSEAYSSPTVAFNVFYYNHDSIYSYFFCNAVIYDNVIANAWYGIHNQGYCKAQITNNSIDCEGAGIYNYNSASTITNNVVIGFYAGIYNYTYDVSPVIDYNDVRSSLSGYIGCSAGTHDISLDPLFVNPSGGDYHLQTTSPCIDAGSNAAPGLPATDLEGDPRVIDGNGDGTSTVDMGADEYLGYAWGGFLSPLSDNVRRVFVPGATIPVEFRVLHPGAPKIKNLTASVAVTNQVGTVYFKGTFAYNTVGDYYYCALPTAGFPLGVYTVTVKVGEDTHTTDFRIGTDVSTYYPRRR